MRTAWKTALGVAGGALSILLLDGHPARLVAGARGLARRRRGLSPVLDARVRTKLERLTPHARALQVTSDHGCVLLTGDVLTEERALLVREVAAVEGVDSVVDLMTEHRGPDGIPALVVETPNLPTVPRVRAVIARSASPALRALSACAGISLAVAGLRLRGARGIPLGVAGGVLIAVGIAGRAGAGALLDRTPLRRVIELDAAIVVSASTEDVFRVLGDLAVTAHLLRHVGRVERRGARRYAWSIAGAQELTWTVEVSLHEGRRIAWQSTRGARVRMRGEVRLERLAPSTTRVRMHLRYGLPFGRDGRILRARLGADPDVQLAEDLTELERLVASAVPPGRALAR